MTYEGDVLVGQDKIGEKFLVSFLLIQIVFLSHFLLIKFRWV